MTEHDYGPKTKIAQETHERKYRGRGEDFEEYATRVADTLTDNYDDFLTLRNILGCQRFLPAGRVQAAVGSPKIVTAFNCFVSPKIEDSMEGIMDVAKFAALTMKQGGGIGYDFSTIRPKGHNITTLDSQASGPLSFMEIFNATCKTVASAGNRRGAQMGVLRVDHPDIEEFIESKTNETELTSFNISVGVTDEFMRAVETDGMFDLVFEGKVYETINARNLYNKLMRATWDWAEPGIIFLDRVNYMNNLWYCEKISATNPCGEQPLPHNGACLLGSFNLVKYVSEDKEFDIPCFIHDIEHVVRAMDNVIDTTIYPTEAQEVEAKQKRRMGLGVTGLANALEIMGYDYGSEDFIRATESILETLRDNCYLVSSELAREKGAFPLYNNMLFQEGNFFKTLPVNIQENIAKHGLRNSHLTSIAPTGTISLSADNISSGIEPVFSHSYDRTIVGNDNSVSVEEVQDWAYRYHGVKGKTANECTPQEHLSVLAAAQRYVDSACSKTINVGEEFTWEDFKDLYMDAWRMGCKGVTTFRAAGKRYGILNEKTETEEASQEEPEKPKEEPIACFFDPTTGTKSCS